MRILLSLVPYFLKYRYRFFGGIFFVVISNFFAVLVPQFTGFIIDKAIGGTGKHTDISSYNFFVRWMIDQINTLDAVRAVMWASIAILALALIRGGFMYLMRQTLVVMSRYVEYDQKSALFDKYLSLDVEEFKKRHLGEFMTTMSEDVGKVRMMVGPAVMYICNILATTSLVLYYMFIKSVPLTIYVLLPLPFMAFLIYKVSTNIYQKTAKVQASLSQISTFARNVYTGVRVVKSFNQNEKFIQRFEQQIDLHKKKNLKLAFVEAVFMPSMSLIIGIALVINVWVGGVYVMEGTLSIGTLAEFVIYLNLLVFPFSSMGWVSDLVQRGAVSQQRISNLMNIKTALPDGNKKPKISGKISFQHVSFSYPDKSKQALSDVSFVIPAKKKIGIVGKVGSGKSTLVDMLLRFYDPSQGQIFSDQTPLTEIEIAYFRKHIALVAQDVFLFSGSIADNIRLAEPTLTDEAIKDLLRAVALWEDVENFPDQIHTVIGEKGVSLSGGQRQRLSIARALAKKSPILVLDDCFSAIDVHTESRIIEYINNDPSIETMIMISHRYTIMPNMDHIFVMHEGRIVEQGRHEDLLKLQLHYSELYQSSLSADAEK